jgi:hypothetical protein
MAGINMTISGNGSSFKVDDACTPDSTACTSTFHDMFASFTAVQDGSFELTARFHESEDLPHLDEEIDLDQGGS